MVDKKAYQKLCRSKRKSIKKSHRKERWRMLQTARHEPQSKVQWEAFQITEQKLWNGQKQWNRSHWKMCNKKDWKSQQLKYKIRKNGNCNTLRKALPCSSGVMPQHRSGDLMWNNSGIFVSVLLFWSCPLGKFWNFCKLERETYRKNELKQDKRRNRNMEEVSVIQNQRWNIV